MGALTKNPCDKVEYIKFDNQKERFLTPQEQQRFIEVLMQHLSARLTY